MAYVYSHGIYSFSGPTGIDGNECPVFCPTKCDYEFEMYCPGGFDANDCEMPDTCIPIKGNSKYFSIHV